MHAWRKQSPKAPRKGCDGVSWTKSMPARMSRPVPALS
jgi:hypothetical protein